MSRLRVVCVVGARPNFIKMAPIVRALQRQGDFDVTLVHTGQHYDEKMSGLFFKQLGLPNPDVHLGVGGGSHAVQTARIMEQFEPVLLERKPAAVIVVGDVNSTLAAAIVAVKLGIRVAHVEAGLRSFERSMPEEINRLLTDAIADLLFTTEPSANENLRREGVASKRIHYVGNVMIDSLRENLKASESSDVCETLGVTQGEYGVLTLHRPANVDDVNKLKGLLEGVAHLAKTHPVIFPCHPRTRQQLEFLELSAKLALDGPSEIGAIRVVDPLGYLDFMKLVANARMVLTDSGGLQEETTVLGVPCLTLRNETERPVTVSEGSNRIVGTDQSEIVRAIDETLQAPPRSHRVPELWDGHAAERIVDLLRHSLSSS